MNPEQWPELRVTDSDIDAPEDAEQVEPVAPSVDVPEPTHRHGVPLAWCAGLAAAALALAVGSVAYVGHRGRTITSVRYENSPVHAIDAGGCPTGENCSPVNGIYGGLAEAVQAHFPDAQTLFANAMIDTSSSGVSRNIRIMQLADPAVTMSVLTQCRPDRATPPNRVQGLTATGPTMAVIVRSFAPNCSIAVVADVPAGHAVPVDQLVALAEDDEARQQ